MEKDNGWSRKYKMDRLQTSYTPCLTCMNTDWADPEYRRCRHERNCTVHDDTCKCKVFTSPSLTRSKIGAVLHLQWTDEDGSKDNIDVDLNCPSIEVTTDYDGTIDDTQSYLMTKTPVGWLEEYRKLENMSAVSDIPGVKRSVRFRMTKWGHVMSRQVRVTVVVVGVAVLHCVSYRTCCF